MGISGAIPSQLLKNLFARESQFWPCVFKSGTDAGFGHLTENGADTALLWNPSFYSQDCPLVLSSGACSLGYLHLKAADQLLLRQTLVGSVNATCDNCPLGIDLSQASFSVAAFAYTLLASCEQTGQVVQNNTGQLPGDVASYEKDFKASNFRAHSWTFSGMQSERVESHRSQQRPTCHDQSWRPDHRRIGIKSIHWLYVGNIQPRHIRAQAIRRNGIQACQFHSNARFRWHASPAFRSRRSRHNHADLDLPSPV